MFDTWCVGIGFAWLCHIHSHLDSILILDGYKACFFLVNGDRIYCINSAIGSVVRLLFGNVGGASDSPFEGDPDIPKQTKPPVTTCVIFTLTWTPKNRRIRFGRRIFSIFLWDLPILWGVYVRFGSGHPKARHLSLQSKKALATGGSRWKSVSQRFGNTGELKSLTLWLWLT